MNALEISNLKKIYSNGVEALKGIDLSVREGDFFALLGPNGAGKSTTIGILTSLVIKTSGKVSIYGHDIDSDFSAAKSCLGVVPQEFNFGVFEKVYNVVLNQAGYYGLPKKLAKERTEKYLCQLGLWEKRDSLSRVLSGGMKRRLMIARALVHEPKILILDEPTAGVDIELRRSMWDFLIKLNQQGVTIILTTHYLEEAESLCRNIAIINHGEIVVNESIKALLSKLDFESFILYLKDILHELPEIEGYQFKLIDHQTLEVLVPAQLGISKLITTLTEKGVSIVSMRNKANRLEELFIKLTSKS